MPGATLPLHIFEPRYRQLTVDLVTGVVPDKQFGVVAVREGWSAGDDADDENSGLHRVGCTAELIDARRLPDGRFDIVTRGVRRFRLLNVDAESRPYLTGEVEYVPDEPARAPDELPALATAARAAHRRYCVTAWKSGEWSEPADEVESAELVAERVRRAFPYTSPDRITIATDCGMKYLPRASAEGKMRAMAGAASMLRAEL